MADRVTQVPTRVIVVGTPKARVTQEPVRAIVVGSPKARVTQVAVRAMVNVPAAVTDAEFDAFFVG